MFFNFFFIVPPYVKQIINLSSVKDKILNNGGIQQKWLNCIHPETLIVLSMRKPLR